MIWPEKESLNEFLTNLNQFHPNLKFTHTHSPSEIDFLDLTIYKGPNFLVNHKLDIKTFQKPQNLYQYLEYTSEHPRNVFTSIILGECSRYLHTNTQPETYAATVRAFQKRLQERQYPNKLVGKVTSRIKFSDRESLLNKANKHVNPTPNQPIFKCYPHPTLNS